MMRAISQRYSQTTAIGGADANGPSVHTGQRKIARKPVSQSWVSQP